MGSCAPYLSSTTIGGWNLWCVGRPGPKRKLIFQSQCFRCENLSFMWCKLALPRKKKGHEHIAIPESCRLDLVPNLIYSNPQKIPKVENKLIIDLAICAFPKIGVPPNGGFIMENPINMDDLGVPLFLETPIWVHMFLSYCCICMFFQPNRVRQVQSESQATKTSITWLKHIWLSLSTTTRSG